MTRALRHVLEPHNERAVWFGIVATFVAALGGRVAPTRFNNYVLFADALLHRHFWLANPGPLIDAVQYRGHSYIVNDPVPALFLLPAVALFGSGVNQTGLAVILGGVAAGLAWLLAERLEVAARPRLVLCAFFFAGTDLFWCASIGDVWFLAQVSAVAFTLFALAELARARPRGWLVGLGVGLAIGSRFTLVMALPVFAYFVVRGNLGNAEPIPGGTRRFLGFGLVVAFFFGLWIAYNQARWGHFWDSGHTIFYHEDRLGQPTGSPFALRNVPNQIWSFLFAPPMLYATYPYLAPSFRGTALTWTSPALAFAFTVRRPQPGIAALWIAAALVAVPSLLYYVNGFSQYGMRHALDFEPFVFVIMLFASYRAFPRWVTVSSFVSIAASIYGLWFWLTFAYPSTN